MADKTKYVVAAPFVIATLEGAAAPLYKGAQVPDNATDAWIEHALSLDLITEGEFEGGFVPPEPRAPLVAASDTGPDSGKSSSRSASKAPDKAT